jgi:hypothetical protein
MGHIDGTAARVNDSSALFLVTPVVLWFTQYLSASCQI